MEKEWGKAGQLREDGKFIGSLFAQDPRHCLQRMSFCIKDIILTRRCALRNNLKVNCILFLSVSKLGQRQADGDLAL